MLTVEVKGISFDNKGAELMLHAIIQQFKERNVKARFVAEPIGSYERRASFKLWQKTRYIRKQINWLAPFDLLPPPYRRIFGLVKDSEVDVVLDASGFSYGDQWSPAVARDRLVNCLRKWRKRRVPVILLPQALGPFKKPQVAATFDKVLAGADLIFARDRHSLAYVSELSPQTAAKKVNLCPDFTNLIKGSPAEEFDARIHQACFIPNSKMVEKRSDGDAYIKFMVETIEQALADNANPFILIHEADNDRRLTKQIMDQLSTTIPVLDPQDALKIKWIIGQSKICVSSRFHGLVSALSQGVPVIATGWSHKYQELLSDYDVANLLFDVTTDLPSAKQELAQLISNEDHYQRTAKKIVSHGDQQKMKASEMWNSVFSLIQKIHYD